MQTACILWRVLSRLALVVAASLLGGCGNKFVMPPEKEITTSLRVTNHVGGAHQRVIVVDGRWIQAFSSSVQIVDPKSLMVIHDVELGEFGHCGPVSDIAVAGKRLYAVVEDDSVVEMSLEAGRPPEVIQSTSSERLGILPRKLSVVDGVRYVSGAGGVVDMGSGQQVFHTDSNRECSRVARAGDELLVCVGRQVKRVSDGKYVGAASALLTLDLAAPADAAAPTPALAYSMQGEQNTLAGLMTADVREIPGGQSTVAVVGEVRSIRWFNDCVWFVGSQRIAGYGIDVDGKTLLLKVVVPILGATDVDAMDASTLALVGTAGRAVYQYDLEHGPEAGEFVVAQREPGRLVAATSDGERILAGSDEGVWSYLINSRAELVSRPFTGGVIGPRVASVANATAEISRDGSTITITPAFTAAPPPTESPGKAGVPQSAPTVAGPFDFSEDKGAKLMTVIAIDGKFWVGHDRGITILKADGGQATFVPKNGDQPATMSPAQPVADRLRMPGPVTHLFALPVGKGAAYVSEFGGMGVVRYIDKNVDTPPPEKKD